MVVYVNMVAKRKFSYNKLNEKLVELGSKATFKDAGPITRGTRKKILWHHVRYQGGVEIGEIPESKLFDISVKGVDEDLIVAALIGWLVRNFCKKINSIEIFPENARSGWTES